jgi:hypothetical protein
MQAPTLVDIVPVLLTALFNPVVIVVAFWMGRYADQQGKLVFAAFGAALAGSVVVFMAISLGIRGVAGVGHKAGGVFIAEFVFGLVWAWLGFRFAPQRPT